MKNNCNKAFATLSLLLSSIVSRSSPPSTIKNATAFVVVGNITSRSIGQSKERSTRTATTTTQTTTMSSGWSSTWKDINNGGNKRWKITSKESHEKAYAHFQKHVQLLKGRVLNDDDDDDDENKKNNKKDDVVKNISVFCPLAGDDPFIYLLWSRGYSVTAIDLVPEALEAMRQGFIDKDDDNDDDDAAIWFKQEESDDDDNHNNGNNDVVWTHKSGRVTLIVGDVLKKRPHLSNSFDAVYDKDSFGALSKELRKPFCDLIADYTKEDGIVYLECKLKRGVVGVDNSGPPFSLRKDDLMEVDNYGGSKFDYVEGLGPVYDLNNAGMQQTGHVFRRRKTHSTTSTSCPSS